MKRKYRGKKNIVRKEFEVEIEFEGLTSVCIKAKDKIDAVRVAIEGLNMDGIEVIKVKDSTVYEIDKNGNVIRED